MNPLYGAFLGAVVVERIVELLVSKAHADALLRRGAVEYGRGHYPWMVALHTAFLAGCALEPLVAHRPFVPALGYPMLALALGAQALRWWAIRTLGVHWNTRVIVVPSSRRIVAGPYRFFPHPNYVAVVVEGFALPLVHTAWITAVVFTVLNAGLLTVRIRAENDALTAAYA